MRDYSDTMQNEQTAQQPNPLDLLGILAEVQKELKAVREDNADMRRTLEAAKNAGHIELDLAQIKHVMTKYFPHDMPDVEPVASPTPKFDQFTGQPLH